MKLTHRITAGALTLVLGTATLTAPLAAQASSEGRRNTALGLGAAAVALLLTQRDKTAGIVAAAGAAIALSQVGNSRDRWGRDRYSDRYDNRDSGYDRYSQYDNRDGGYGRGSRSYNTGSYGRNDRNSDYANGGSYNRRDSYDNGGSYDSRDGYDRADSGRSNRSSYGRRGR